MTDYKIEAGTAQHIGARASQNDRTALFTGARAPGFVMAVVADGLIDGMAADQVLLTARQLFDEFKPGDNPSVERLDAMLRGIFAEAHFISKMNGVRSKLEPTSSAAILILTPQGRAVWAHVGDCRMYRFSGGQCAERTNDAGYLQYLTDEEKIAPEVAKAHRRTPSLHNVIGSNRREPFVTIGSHDGLRAGDAFLLCSDGLWHYFTDAEFAAVTSKNTPREAADMLFKKSKERAKGIADNCTMALIRMVALPKAEIDYSKKAP